MESQESQENLESKSKGIIPFVTEVARYFMDFLETDFHKVRNPKRHIQYKNSNNLQLSIDLTKYKKYNALIWKVIRSGFKDDGVNYLKNGVYTHQIPKSLLDLITVQIDLIQPEEINSLNKMFESEVSLGLSKYPNDTAAAITFSLDAIGRVMREKFIAGFISKIKEPVERVTSSTVDSIFQIEEELTEILIKPFEDVVTIIINQLSLSNPVDSQDLLSQIFELSDVKYKLESFFKGFSVSDLFLEVTELFNNKSLLEKQEFYLYFCDITFENHTYPLFYIPVQIEKTTLGFSFQFDTLLFVNKKAIQFVSEKHNSEIERQGSLRTFLERIIYLSEKGDHLIGEIDGGLKEAITYFGLSPYIDIHNPEKQMSKSKGIQISNRCYLSIFDKSDESLVNDYEEILLKLKEGDDLLASAFQLLIDDFITNNPVPFTVEVEDDWNNTSFSEKLVYSSPVPLNEEQRQILIAINKPNCKYITVEGPPGTGKSHTITAIVCDSILKNQSVLVLSDKKEALDVVENKITETMNKVRLDKDFQNPILRLGQTGNTYSKIFSTTSMERIKEHYKATKSVYSKVESDIDQYTSTLKRNLDSSVVAYEKIKLTDIAENLMLEDEVFTVLESPLDLDDLKADMISHHNLLSLRNAIFDLKHNLTDQEYNLGQLFKKYYPNELDKKSFINFLNFINIINDTRSEKKNDIHNLSLLREVSTGCLANLEEFVARFTQLKSKWFGYFLKGKEVSGLCVSFGQKIQINFENPHYKLDELRSIASVLRYSETCKAAKEINSNFEFKIDFIKAVHQIIALNIKIPNVDELLSIFKQMQAVDALLEKFKRTKSKIGINENDIFSYINNKFSECSDEVFDKLLRYLELNEGIVDKFNTLPDYSFVDNKSSVEELVTTQMTYKIDERVVNFYENHRNDAKTLSGVISKKQRFDKATFEKLKDSFPCILAGIRDFSEFIPLESELFDLVIIDEASQVSIAQAFPALLRGKKIIVLGDKRQFSNVKSAQARSTTNQEYLNSLSDVFLKTISDDPIKIERLEKFNIKTSILEFFERINNYSIMLKKHFRGYRELISYSSKYFYEDALQAIKIRAKSIDDIITITLIDHDSRSEITNNSNKLEIDAIVSEVERILKEEPSSTVGIITPHTNQQKLLADAFSRHEDKETFDKQLKLKIMTFDTCQGEERDIILYSMVASPISDRLWGVFIKDLGSVDLEIDGKIKVQRLNVGFSRAKERMHFFLSKPIENFTGSIGEALLHYKKIIENAKRLPETSDTDERSPMEKKILSWLQETYFFKNNISNIELHAQFHLGEYLKQLDKRYSHPAYIVDFLLIYTDEEKKKYKIIIEYDGFEYHFQNHTEINEFNYGEYYTEDHIYREKILEGYGCCFLRVNRFNLGEDPVETLNRRLEDLVKKKTSKIHS